MKHIKILIILFLIIIITLLYLKKNRKEQFGLGGDDDLDPKELERRKNNENRQIIESRKNDILRTSNNVDTKKNQAMTDIIEKIKSKQNVSSSNKLVKKYNKICSSDGKSCITINEFNKIKNFLNMMSNMSIDNNLVKVNDGIKINDNILLNYNNFNVSNIKNKILSGTDNVDNSNYTNTSMLIDNSLLDISLNKILDYFVVQPGSLFGYNIDGLNTSLFATGKLAPRVDASTTTAPANGFLPTFDRTLSTIGIGYTGFNFNLYDNTSVLKGIEIKRQNLDPKYDMLLLYVDVNPASNIVLYTYDDTKTPKYNILGNYTVGKRTNRFNWMTIPLPKITEYTGKLFFSTTISTMEYTSCVMIGGINFISNTYNFLRIPSNMFNLNSVMLPFPSDKTHSIFTITELSNGLTDTTTTTSKLTSTLVNVNTDYYLTIPIINSKKNKYIYFRNGYNINTFNTTQKVSNFNLTICDKNFNLNSIEYPLSSINNNLLKDNSNFTITSTEMFLTHVSNIYGLYEYENVYAFFIPAEYINNNFVTIHFKIVPVNTATTQISIYEILTFDDLI